MKIECLTRFLDDRIQYEKDDICTVSDEDGARFCANGWAKDMAGKVATGEPQGGANALEVHNMTLGQNAPGA